MKKAKFLILGLILIVFCSAVNSQDTTFDFKIRQKEQIAEYTGGDRDTITPNSDTVDYVIFFNLDGFEFKKIAILTVFDTIAGADTTVIQSLSGKEFIGSPDSTAVIAASTSDAVSGPGIKQQIYAVDTGSSNISLREWRLRNILSGDDATGSGVKITSIKIRGVK
jgi:hypothetical protein